MPYDDDYFRPYVSAAERKRRALKAAARLDRKARPRAPIVIAGRFPSKKPVSPEW